MDIFLIISFFALLLLLLIFVAYKMVEYHLNKEFTPTKYLRSFDPVVKRALSSLTGILLFFRYKIYSFILHKILIPIKNLWNNFKKKISNWYINTLDKLREKHISKNSGEPRSSFLKEVSDYKNGSSNKTGEKDEDSSVENKSLHW